MAAYKENDSSSLVLIRLIKNWKNESFVTESALMDLSKAFDFIPHDLKMKNNSLFFNCYLKQRRENLKINDILSFFKTLFSGVPQGSILRKLKKITYTLKKLKK